MTVPKLILKGFGAPVRVRVLALTGGVTLDGNYTYIGARRLVVTYTGGAWSHFVDQVGRELDPTVRDLPEQMVMEEIYDRSEDEGLLLEVRNAAGLARTDPVVMLVFSTAWA